MIEVFPGHLVYTLRAFTIYNKYFIAILISIFVSSIHIISIEHIKFRTDIKKGIDREPLLMDIHVG